MTYSSKGRLIFRSATFAVAAAFLAYARLFHPSQGVAPYLMGAMILLVFALAIPAFFYLDEIERARKMRVTFYGAMLGVGIAMLFFAGILLQPSLLEVLADMLSRHRPHPPTEYFLLGLMVMIVAQALCSLGISLALRLKPQP